MSSAIVLSWSASPPKRILPDSIGAARIHQAVRIGVAAYLERHGRALDTGSASPG